MREGGGGLQEGRRAGVMREGGGGLQEGRRAGVMQDGGVMPEGSGGLYEGRPDAEGQRRPAGEAAAARCGTRIHGF